MLWGIVIGTYSSLFIAAPIVYYIQPNRRAVSREPTTSEGEGGRSSSSPERRPRGAKS
jgi:hypothetical protein